MATQDLALSRSGAEAAMGFGQALEAVVMVVVATSPPDIVDVGLARFVSAASRSLAGFRATTSRMFEMDKCHATTLSTAVTTRPGLPRVQGRSSFTAGDRHQQCSSTLRI